MTIYLRRKINVTPHPWLKVKRPGRKAKIAGAGLHSSRSGVLDGDDGPRTERWAANAANRVVDRSGSVSGSFQDIIIFEDGTQVDCLNWNTEMPTWTAGYGGDPRTWALSDHYLQIEVGQGTLEEPFTDAAIDSLAQRVAELAHEYNFPIKRIPYVDQLGDPPRGIVSHEGSANGRYYGKTDPGPMFPWAKFLAKAQAYYDGETDMAEVTRAEFEEFKRITTERYVDDHKWLNEVDAKAKALEKRLQTMDEIDSQWRIQHEKGHKPPVLP